jgi:quinol monooxygenase YgiN
MTLALVVDFTVRAEHRADFERALAEPGCQQFDICRDPADASRIFLYERYDDQAAIDAHLAAAHFLAFDALTRSWVEHKSVRRLELVD